MNGSPNIVLMQAYSLRKDYGKYLNYMIRKKAIKGQEYLDSNSKKELEKINSALADSGYFKSVESDPQVKKDQKLDEKTQSLTEEKTFFTADNDDYGKYIGYMIRINALAKKEKLSEKEQQERDRLKNKVDQYVNVDEKPKLNSADDTLIGFYSSEQKHLKLKDAEHAREMLRKGRDNGSVLWEPVISFDNDFLEREGILNRKTGELHDDILKEASYKMMNEAIKREKLNKPYWSASIHRNTDNIHIHFALVEQENSRDIITYKGEKEPKAKFKLSTIYAMKSAFSNELIDITKAQDRITKDRNKLREVVIENAKEQMKSPSFQKELNSLMKMLPDNHKQWQYATLHKINPKITDQVDKITNHLLQGNKDYDEWSDLVKDVDELYKGQYGESQNENKQYGINQFQDLQKRCGNKLLTELKNMDMQAQKIKKYIPSNKKIKNSDNYIQECLALLEHKDEKSNTKEPVQTSKIASSGSLHSNKDYSKLAKERQRKFKKMVDSRKFDQQLRKMMKPIMNKRNVQYLRNSVQKEFENGLTTIDKVKAMNEFNRWHSMDRE